MFVDCFDMAAVSLSFNLASMPQCDIIWKTRVKIIDRLLQSAVDCFIWPKNERYTWCIFKDIVWLRSNKREGMCPTENQLTKFLKNWLGDSSSRYGVSRSMMVACKTLHWYCVQTHNGPTTVTDQCAITSQWRVVCMKFLLKFVGIYGESIKHHFERYLSIGSNREWWLLLKL